MSATPIRLDSPRMLDALRAQTGHLHTRLEKRMPFFSPGMNHALYVRLIQAYYGFYQPLEAALMDCMCAPSGLDLALRLKAPTLQRDLQALGHDVHSFAQWPVCQDLPLIDSPGACLGVLYVLEGATLGGQVLRRQMHATLGLDEHTGAAFMNVYGVETGRRWKAFLALLDEQPADPALHQAAAQAACATFNCFEQWLERQGVLS
ncbi:heme oxygenase [Pseudomonas sp. Leaf127]|uniref:biliverdin-producing heme oxygenase n=1 Tax=Pseudomonas sp. Leaf127 TaxID=1736267 RepID=UPI00070347BA|nr:biliverdin-producing heme oxygenase [Pseudomonas sp. Leaf127]KQQ57063.1 heme oxygenase [Pseudomonas sp. Leaf127]